MNFSTQFQNSCGFDSKTTYLLREKWKYGKTTKHFNQVQTFRFFLHFSINFWFECQHIHETASPKNRNNNIAYSTCMLHVCICGYTYMHGVHVYLQIINMFLFNIKSLIRMHALIRTRNSYVCMLFISCLLSIRSSVNNVRVYTNISQIRYNVYTHTNAYSYALTFICIARAHIYTHIATQIKKSYITYSFNAFIHICAHIKCETNKQVALIKKIK